MTIYRCQMTGQIHNDPVCVYSRRRHDDVTAQCIALLAFMGAR